MSEYLTNLSLQRYAVKHWGNLDNEDKQTNKDALKYPDDLYLLAAYETCKGYYLYDTEDTTCGYGSKKRRETYSKEERKIIHKLVESLQ